VSYHFEGHFRTKASALAAVTAPKRQLPQPVVNLLVDAIEALSDDSDDRFIFVKASGHQHTGLDYAQSRADLLVEPRAFFRDSAI